MYTFLSFLNFDSLELTILKEINFKIIIWLNSIIVHVCGDTVYEIDQRYPDDKNISYNMCFILITLHSSNMYIDR